MQPLQENRFQTGLLLVRLSKFRLISVLFGLSRPCNNHFWLTFPLHSQERHYFLWGLPDCKSHLLIYRNILGTFSDNLQQPTYRSVPDTILKVGNVEPFVTCHDFQCILFKCFQMIIKCILQCILFAYFNLSCSIPELMQMACHIDFGLYLTIGKLIGFKIFSKVADNIHNEFIYFGISLLSKVTKITRNMHCPRYLRNKLSQLRDDIFRMAGTF